MNKIEIVRGTTKSLKIIIQDANGNEYNLRNEERLLFGVKKRLYDDCVIFKTVDTKTDDGYVVKLSPEDTSNLECGDYMYDVGLESGTDFYSVIPMSEFCICENIVKKGDSL